MPAPTRNTFGEGLEAYGQIVMSNTKAISRFGGRLAVLYKFVDAALPQLTLAQRMEVEHCCRQGIEHVLSLSDDGHCPLSITKRCCSRPMFS
ncbi:hypothetical protein V4C53_45385 [Paraburkholderia azotifigens]|uniref:hypothetical protein n=1 Tax=Paraburkholderia azotifigens TaxID=2057004 RepID=UPI00317CEC09